MVGCVVLASLVGGTSPAPACDTPVYRYAMYRWRPAPYQVFLLHDAAPGESLQTVAAKIQQMSDDPQTGANVVYRAVDLSADPELSSVPPDVQRLWERQEDPSLPQHLVLTPHGDPVFAGRLNETDVDGLIDSPVRREIAKRLEAGHACVLVLLSAEPATDADEPPDEAESTDAAEQQVKQLVSEIAAGKIDLFSPAGGQLFAPTPAVPSDESDADESADSENPPHEISYLRLSRSDADEQWLIRGLLALEHDLHEFRQPMVFAVYGRGRALPPYIGRGITRDNLLDVVQYVTGACSCTVKEENPGMDLLVRHDWDTAAELVAERFGAEEGNEAQFADDQLFPRLVIPSSDSDLTLADAGDDADNDEGGPPAGAHAGDTASSPEAHDPVPVADSAAASASAVPASTAPAGTAISLGMTIFVGMFVGMIVLAVATLLVVGKR